MKIGTRVIPAVPRPLWCIGPWYKSRTNLLGHTLSAVLGTEINIYYRDIGLLDSVAEQQEEQETPSNPSEVA